jgi:hypothetical protein
MLMLSLMVLRLSLLVLVVSLPRAGSIAGDGRDDSTIRRGRWTRGRGEASCGQIDETGRAGTLRSRPVVTMLITAQG